MDANEFSHQYETPALSSPASAPAQGQAIAARFTAGAPDGRTT
jgi:hypothetical protein